MCQSRIDYIFMSTYLTNKVSNVALDWGYEKSDHASVMVGLHIGDETEMGPGLIRVNSLALDDPTNLSIVKTELLNLISQIPLDWDPHMKLEFVKVSMLPVSYST